MKLLSFEDILLQAPDEIKILLESCKNTKQNPKWHPEGSVFNHTKIVCERALETKDLNLIIAALFHDLGKVKTTELNKKGSWSSHGHEFESVKILEKHKDWVVSVGCEFEQVHTIVKEHMRIQKIDEMRKSKQDILRSNKWFDKILLFSTFDDMTNLKK